MAKDQYTDFSLHRRAMEAIAQGYLTNSKRPETFIKGVYPTHVTKGYGCFLEDHRGKKYIDFICGLGTNLLGYNHASVTSAIIAQLNKGSLLSLGTKTEVELAEKLKEFFPWAHKVKILKTGTEACLAAVKIARAHTKRQLVLSEGYHGWGDEFIALTEPAYGVSDYIDKNLEKFEGYVGKDVAAVILEPVGLDASKERIVQLKSIEERCRKMGTLVIYDEIITGFRTPKFSMSNYFGLNPDILCLGKALGGGMPISAVLGKGYIMDSHDYFISGTYYGETASMGAALEFLSQIQTKHSLDHLWEKGDQFLIEFNKLFDDLKIVGYPSRGSFQGNERTKALFWQEAVLSGLLFGPSWFFSFPHIEVMDIVLSTCKDIAQRIKAGGVELIGEMPKLPFAAQQRGQK